MVHSDRYEAEMRLRRRAARALRVLEYAFLSLGWLALFGAIVLYMAGKHDEGKLTLAFLDSVMAVIEARLVEEFAGLIERREWP